MAPADTEPSISKTVAAATTFTEPADPPKAVSTSGATVVDQYSAILDQESLPAPATPMPAASIARQVTEPSTSTVAAAATAFGEPAESYQSAAGPTSGETAVDQRSLNPDRESLPASVTVTPGAPIAQTEGSNRPPSVRVQEEASDLPIPVPLLDATKTMEAQPPEPLPAATNTERPENASGGSVTSVAAGIVSTDPPVLCSVASIGRPEKVEQVPQAAQDASQHQDAPLPPPADQILSHKELQQGVVEHEQNASVPPNKFSDALSAALSAELEATEDVIDPAHAIQGAISNLAGGLQGLWRR
jgi:hypothetical protein